jgi:hypothetical protein
VVKSAVTLLAPKDPEWVTFEREEMGVTWCAAVVCENCGFVRLHALSPLGLSPSS